MANSIVSLSSMPDMLLPGALGIMQYYDMYPDEWQQIFHVVPSIKNTEIYIENEALNGAGRFSDGTNIPLGSFKQVFKTEAENFNYGVGFVITANAIEDNLYPDQFPKGMLGIRDNMKTFQEYEGIAIFDNAFNSTDPEYVLADGQPLCSFNHPISQNVISNTLSSAQLSLTSYQDLIITIQNFQDYSAQPRKILPTKLLVGIPNQFIAKILTGSQYNPENANNSINPIVAGGYIHGEFITSHYMVNSSNYFLLTDYRETGAIFQRRKSIQIQMTTDQANRNLSVYGNERYRFIVPNFRCVAGVQGF